MENVCLASEVGLYVVQQNVIIVVFVFCCVLKMSSTLISSEGTVYTNAGLFVCLPVCLSLYI